MTQHTHRPAGTADDIGCRNLRWSAALLDGLATAGMDTLVLSPGSRSTPLVIAAQRQPQLRLVPIVDERSAAFFALGVARATGRPVAVLATSGSAPSHWYPAVIEAHEAGIPLVLLSADRPPLLRHWGANQTIDQTRLFGAFVRECHDPGLPLDDADAHKALRALGLRAGSISLGPHPGPVHVNLPFDEPLVPRGDCPPSPSYAAWTTAPGPAGTLPQNAGADPGPNPGPDTWLRKRPEPGSVPGSVSALEPALLRLPPGRGLIVCGPGRFDADFPDALARCAARLGLPLLADPLSGLRFGPQATEVISHYDALLRNDAAADGLRPDWVLRFGRAPVSKRLGQWLQGIPALLVDAAGGWSDPSHDVIRRLCVEPTRFCRGLAERAPHSAPDTGPDTAPTGTPCDWLQRWRAADQRVAAIAKEQLAHAPWCEGHIIRALLAQIPAGEALLCANSMPIRQIDCWSGIRADALHLHGNRGVSGIDGQLSTLAGLDCGGPPTWALLGDLSLLHDLSGLLQASRLRRPILVINNGGGRIFDYLPQHGLPDFERLWRTPMEVDLKALCAPFGLRHRLVQNADQLDQALGDATAALVEIRIDADLSRHVHQTYWGRVASAALTQDVCR
ncbi:2-succinyl-5-enolpyruvyl-6-hydroxy-3-cyclohexene-1-carboxylic-acid synthase [Thiohalocapsa marina]|uniref:2-succinyl-5-enolpyruvyl-6-hydroxy-3- cyclohexene-1-carboxylic-acid synthase n=1 Tax=Thiohalocapsa marina TaxID=424902 RepID=UPI001FECF2CE|nr:2-succinyl-5-enolpyruvyl-6-hydroxy-3-cyclohexene-1-carboxylic-acid synthase [Thiohalocapsa marina]